MRADASCAVQAVLDIVAARQDGDRRELQLKLEDSDGEQWRLWGQDRLVDLVTSQDVLVTSVPARAPPSSWIEACPGFPPMLGSKSVPTQMPFLPY